jgi:hypothetical protein
MREKRARYEMVPVPAAATLRGLAVFVMSRST